MKTALKMEIDQNLLDVLKNEGIKFQSMIIDYCRKNNYEPAVALEAISNHGRAMSHAADQTLNSYFEEIIMFVNPKDRH